jgi:beta-galactosidase
LHFWFFLFLSPVHPQGNLEKGIFYSGWKFLRADAPGAEKSGFDDSGWRVLDLPHDYSIETLPEKEGVKQIGPFSEESEGGESTGHVVGGTAWYRKHFKIDSSDKSEMISVMFDGVYMDADVWINGVHLGNHPSVIIWSIGNEIPERAHPKGLKITKMLKKKVKELDPGRPVTEAICCGRWEKTAPAFALLDLHGYNYRWYKYESDHEQYPERIVIGTESFAKEALENWEMVEKYPWVIGDFVWTGMDYLGESGLGHTRLDNEPSGHLMHWPWFNAWCGDIDLIGFKKPQSYYRDVVWKESKLEMMVHKLVPEGRLEVVSGWGWPDEYPHWNWNGHEGENMQVSVYSRCDEVRLEINGEVIGTKSVSVETNLTATFDVPFQAGELKAIGLVDGKEVVEKVFETTGQPAKIRLTPDRNKISANRNDLAYVTVEVVDEGNNLVPNADMPVNFSVKGEGELIAVGNGNPADMKNFQSAECTTFNGRCILVIRPFNKSGEIEVSATNNILSSTSIIIQTD